MVDTVALLKALADETRLRIVSLLLEADDLCACEIEAVLEVNQSNLSRHLARLRVAGLITARRSGHWMHHTVAELPRALADALRGIACSARAESPALQTDLARLTDYRTSGHTCTTIREWLHTLDESDGRDRTS